MLTGLVEGKRKFLKADDGQVENYIGELNPCKSMQPDSLQFRMLRDQAACYHHWKLMEIRERSLHNLRKANVASVFIKGQKDDPDYYRPAVVGKSCGGKSGSKTSWNTLLGTQRSRWLGAVSRDLPRVKHSWPIWLSSAIKCWGLWMIEKSGYHLLSL